MSQPEDVSIPPFPTERARIIARVKSRVLKSHFNAAGVDYKAWMQSVDQRTPELITAELAEFERGMRQIVEGLGTSHTAFYRDTHTEPLPQHSINATLRRSHSQTNERWMFLDVFEDGPADKGGVKPGDFLIAIDGAEVHPPAMPHFGYGTNHRLAVGDISGSNLRELTVSVPYRKGNRSVPPIVEPRSLSYRIIAPRVGLLKVLYFPGAVGLKFGKQLDSAIANLKAQGITRLVIDLRGSIGGGLGLARLASYLCPGSIPIGYDVTPRRLRSGYKLNRLPRVPMPANWPMLLLTLARFSVRDKSLALLTQGLGPRPFHGRIAMLINEWTASAAEMLAGFAADQKLATLVGDKTSGNVLGATNFKVGSGYVLRIPIFGWYTPHGNFLEGRGVSPDIRVDVDPQLLRASVDQPMEKALEILSG